MSLRDVEDLVSELPYALRNQVAGYARSVQVAAPTILVEAGLDVTPNRVDQLTFLAGVRRLEAIVGSSYWTLYNANRLLTETGGGVPVVGRTEYSTTAPIYRRLRALYNELQQIIENQGLRTLLRMSYGEAARELMNGR